MSCYIHHVPGRLRLNNPLLKSKKNYDKLKKKLHRLVGINTIDHNDRTGSVVVLYNPNELESHSILRAFEKAGYFDPAEALTIDHYMHKAASKIWKFLTMFL